MCGDAPQPQHPSSTGSDRATWVGMFKNQHREHSGWRKLECTFNKVFVLPSARIAGNDSCLCCLTSCRMQQDNSSLQKSLLSPEQANSLILCHCLHLNLPLYQAEHRTAALQVQKQPQGWMKCFLTSKLGC